MPILLHSGADDDVTPGFHADIMRRGVAAPERVRHVAVPDAGRHAFQTAFPPSPPASARTNRAIEEFLRAMA